MNQLDSVKKFSTITIVDTGNIKSIQKYTTQDETTINPLLILQSVLADKKHQKSLHNAILYTKKKGSNTKNKIINVSNKLSVNIGTEILKQIPGLVLTGIDVHHSFNYEMSIKNTIEIINLYKNENIDTKKILIKLTTTWQGIQAAKELKKYNIKFNLTLLFSAFMQAQACSESNVYLISSFVGRIYDWYNHKYLLPLPYLGNIDTGVQLIQKIFNFSKKYNYSTIIIAASFRNIKQIIALAGYNRLTISPNLLNILYNTTTIKKKLFIPNQKINNLHTPLSKENFHKKTQTKCYGC